MLSYVGVMCTALGLVGLMALAAFKHTPPAPVIYPGSGPSVAVLRVVPAPGPGRLYNTLQSVSVVSASDAWASGIDQNHEGTGRFMLQHWDGTRWSVTRVPGLDQGHGPFLVKALSSHEVWALGSERTRRGIVSVVVRWNGVRWSKTRLPGTFARLSVDSPTDAWAVQSGSRTLHANRQVVLAAHWNGVRWSPVTIPLHPPGHDRSDIFAIHVAAASPRAAWIVGDYCGRSCAFIVHWDGTRWSKVRLPGLGPISLSSVSADSPSDVWAVGNRATGRGGPPFALHFDGRTWSEVPIGLSFPYQSPPPEPVDVSATSPTNVWIALGGEPKLLRWDGTTWSMAAEVVPGDWSQGDFAQVSAIAALSPTEGWAVGTTDAWGGSRAFVFHW